MRTVILLAITLAVVTATVYWQVGNHDFVNFDDDDYVYDNAHVSTGFTPSNIVWAFTSAHSANWHPITWLSHMADAELYGLNPRGHHLTNVAIHIATTLLLFFLLVRLTGSAWSSAFVAAMFALHPLHVESVAWVAERKDVLSAFFWCLTLLLYAEYIGKKGIARYLLTILSFLLGLMSKPMLVTLPLIMLLMDFWPLNRYELAEGKPKPEQRLAYLSTLTACVKEKIPFFVCTILSVAVTIYAQQTVGAIKSVDLVPISLRIANATTAYVKYIGKMFWPTDLAVLYPLPAEIPLWQVISSLLILLAITFAVIRLRNAEPYLILGWFWFLISLIPVIGFVQIGFQSMADRYTYIPLIGLFIMVAWGIPALTKHLPYRRALLCLFAGVAIAASTVMTWRQLGYWQNSITLYQHTLRVTSNNLRVHFNLGIAFADQGRLDEAMAEYRKALAINPNFVRAYNSLGLALVRKGDAREAIHAYQKALEIDPDNIDVHYNLGFAYAMMQMPQESAIEFQKVRKLNPNYFKAKMKP